METATLGSFVSRSMPGLGGALVAAGLRVAQEDSGAVDLVTTPSTKLRARRGMKSALVRSIDVIELTVAPEDDVFGMALAAEVLRPAHLPVASDAQSRLLLAEIGKVAAFDIGVLLQGPTGSGKEVVVRHLHGSSRRSGGAFVAVNCAALPEAMLEALLFGHERGAFTGAAQSSKGLFRAADGGTLFLDEIGEMPLGLQAKLLRVLQEREVLPIGASAAVRVDTRVVAATNRDLAAEAQAGRFRADLYYRLSAYQLRTLPLASRPGDLIPLTANLLLKFGAAWGRFSWPSPQALAKLASHIWPGNVRELENVLQRALVLSEHGRIEAGDVRFDSPAASAHVAERFSAAPEPTLGDIVRVTEFEAIDSALAACNGRRIETAARLGISERTLRYKLAEMAQHRSGRPAMAALQ